MATTFEQSPGTDWASAKAAVLVATAALDDFELRVADPHDAAVARREAARDPAIDAEVDRLHAARIAAERVLMALPAPDGPGFAFKYLLAKGDQRATDCWNDVLERDAKRLVQPIDTTVRDAFEAWAAAWVAWNAHLRDHDDTDPENQRLRDDLVRLETALAAMPPRSADDMLFKLLPLTMGYISASGGPFAIHLDARDPDDDTLDGKAMRGLAHGMLALSPRIAELCALRWPPREPKGGAAEAFERVVNDYAVTRTAVNSGVEPDGGPIGDAYNAAADAMDQAVPTSFEQFARKFVCVHEDGRPTPEIEQELMAQARRLLDGRAA